MSNCLIVSVTVAGQRRLPVLTVPEEISSLLPVTALLPAPHKVVQVTAVVPGDAAGLHLARTVLQPAQGAPLPSARAQLYS